MHLLLGSLWFVVRSKVQGFWSHFELVWRDPGQRENHRTWRNHSKEHTGILRDVNGREYLSICAACLGGCPGFACGVCWDRSVTGIHPLIQLLRGLFILTTQVSLFILQFHHRRGWEKEPRWLLSQFAAADRNKPCHLSPKLLCRSFTRCLRGASFSPIPFCIIQFLSVCLSFSFPLPHPSHPSAALHCWRQQAGSPLYFSALQIDTGG